MIPVNTTLTRSQECDLISMLDKFRSRGGVVVTNEEQNITVAIQSDGPYKVRVSTSVMPTDGEKYHPSVTQYYALVSMSLGGYIAFPKPEDLVQLAEYLADTVFIMGYPKKFLMY